MKNFFNGHSLGIRVLKHESGEFENGGAGNTIYFKISNQTSKKVDIQVEELFKINSKNAQFEKDYWLTGFSVDDTSIQAGAYKTAGAIFLNSVSGNINKTCKTGIIVKDKTNGFIYDALFILKDYRWSLLSCDITEEQIIPKLESKLKKSVERLELFEEKLGVRLDNISVKTDEYYKITVLGEIFSSSGESLNQNIYLNANLYNSDGDLIGTESEYIDVEDFMGYDTFKFYFYEDDIALKTNKIRLFVKKS